MTDFNPFDNAPCPFCGGTLTTVCVGGKIMPDGSISEKQEERLYEVDHAEPLCENFRNMGCIDFMNAVEKFWEQPKQ